MRLSQLVITFLFAVVGLMGGCASKDSGNAPTSSSQPGVVYGVVDSIDVIRGDSGGIGAGAVIGGVVGGVVGRQVGGGTGQDIATVAGVVGGAVAGHQIEKSNSQQDVYRIKVRLDSGWYQTVTQSSLNELHVGDRARIENDQATRY